MTEGLIRQRRNLIVTSFIILVICLGNIRIDHFSIAGINIDFSANQTFAYQLLWASWAYFLYRYVIYFYCEAPEAFKMTWVKTFEKVINPHVEKAVRKEFNKPNTGCGFSYSQVRRNGYNWKGQVFDDSPTGVSDVTVSINRTLISFCEIFAFFQFVLFTKEVTDYVAPIGFALIIFGISLFADWPGSIQSLIG